MTDYKRVSSVPEGFWDHTSGGRPTGTIVFSVGLRTSKPMRSIACGAAHPWPRWHVLRRPSPSNVVGHRAVPLPARTTVCRTPAPPAPSATIRTRPARPRDLMRSGKRRLACDVYWDALAGKPQQRPAKRRQMFPIPPN